jgi:ribosome-associated protein
MDETVERALGLVEESFMIEQALVEPKKRAKSRVNRVGKEQRLQSKKARGTVKANRGKVEW